MTVKELRAKLSLYDNDVEVIIVSDNPELNMEYVSLENIELTRCTKHKKEFRDMMDNTIFTTTVWSDEGSDEGIPCLILSN